MAPIGLENSIQQLNVLLSKLESKRQEFVDAIQRRKAILRELLLINTKMAHLQIGQAYRYYLKQQREMRSAEAKLQTKQKEVDETSGHLKALELQKSNVGLAIENINNALDYVFFSHGRLSIELKNDKYYLKSNGNDVKPKSVSLGERNIIALCYFFTKILENTNEKDEFRDSCLIILDDPISSFDMENKVGLYTFFRMMFDKVMKNNSESKIINFTHSLETMLNFGKACSDIKSDYILFELQNNQFYDFKYKSRNDYQKMLNEIYNYALIDNYNIENELDDTIGNTMRKLLESYSTFNYNKGIEELTRNDKILDKLEKENQRQYYNNFMYRLILNNESHTYDNTRTINFYDYISREEKVKTAKSILLLLYLLDKTHLQLYFNNDSYLEIIKSWEEEIIPEMY